MYQHRDLHGTTLQLPVGKAVCVGRNYAEHARELNNPVPTAPLLFLKPSTAMVPLEGSLALPADQGEVHHELEVALLIGARLAQATEDEVDAAIWGFGLGLDLTLREVQSRLKAQGHPWEIAKAFDGSAPLSPFQPGLPPDWSALRFTLEVNGTPRQRGHTADMLFAIRPLVAAMSRHFTLLPGDVILTGTPAGVGPLRTRDALVCTLEGVGRWESHIAAPSAIKP